MRNKFLKIALITGSIFLVILFASKNTHAQCPLFDTKGKEGWAYVVDKKTKQTSYQRFHEKKFLKVIDSSGVIVYTWSKKFHFFAIVGVSIFPVNNTFSYFSKDACSEVYRLTDKNLKKVFADDAALVERINDSSMWREWHKPSKVNEEITYVNEIYLNLSK